MKKFFAGVFFVLVTILGVSAQTGNIAGKIIDELSGEELVGATAVIKGTTNGSATDFEGNYAINSLAPGTYIVVFSYVAYQTKEVADIVVTAGKTTTLNVTLSEKVTETEEVVIQATYKKESINALLVQQKTAPQIGDGISAEVIKQSPVNNTGDVLKKVSGASIQGGKFAVIRGLNDRYNSAYINGAPLPSTEPDRRAFSFDIIPSGMLDNMIISKAATPDMPGDFAGGIIQLNTRDFPITNYYNVSLSLGYNTVTTGKTFYDYKGGSLDWAGFDNVRKLPEGLAEDDKGRIIRSEANSKKFANDWGSSPVSTLPNINFSYSMGQIFKKDSSDREFASVFGVSYNYSYRTNAIRRQQRLVESSDNQLLLDAQDTQYVTEVLWGALWNLSYKFNKNHKISLKNLFNVNAEDQTIHRQAINYDASQSQRAESYYYIQNNILSSQLSGDHYFPKHKIKTHWVAGYNHINRDIPNYRIIQYQKGVSDPDSLYNVFLGPSASERYGGRLFQKLQEDLGSFGADMQLPINTGKRIKTELKVGGYLQSRSRSFEARFMGYTYGGAGFNPRFFLPVDKIFAPENIAGNLFLLKEETNPNDKYTASSDLRAAYFMFDNKFGRRLRAVWGLRFESFVQRLDSRKQGSGQPVNVGKQNNDPLPSINLTYELSSTSNLRASYSRTLSRPEFRELAPFGFFDYNNFSVVTGNDSLTRALINNFDLRYEIYPGEGQLFSISAFYKQFKDPIEGIIIPNAGAGSFNASFKNVPTAFNYGAELEIRKNFSFLNKESEFLRNMVLFGNFAYIISEVDLSTVSSAVQKKRPLQGQSPYVFNAGLQVKETKSGLFLTTTVNRVGRRIIFVGTGDAGLFPNLWENPRTVWDLQITRKFGKLDLKISASDILAQKLIFYQDRNKNGKMDSFDSNEDIHFTSYTLGRTISFGASYSF